MLEQIDTARQTLEAQLEALRSADRTHLHDDVRANASARLLRLNFLRDQLVGGANDVAALRADISAAVASTLAYTSDARGAASTSPLTAQQAALQQASVDARRAVSDFERDFYQRRIFDPYLKFASAEDEQAYREREAARQREIEKARAEHTPEGDLRAVNLSIAQMDDAGAHGADRNPEFKRRRDALVKTSDTLTSTIGASRATTSPQAKTETSPIADTVDPLASVAAKAPEAKGPVAKLLAAGISAPQADNIGHGVGDKAAQSAAPTRAI